MNWPLGIAIGTVLYVLWRLIQIGGERIRKENEPKE